MSKKCRAYSESKLGLEPPDNRKSFYAGWDAALEAAMAQEQTEPVQDSGFWGRVAARQASRIKQLETAVQVALEALKLCTPNPRSTDDDYAEQGWKEQNAAITALRAALVQQVEPAQMHPSQFAELIKGKEAMIGVPVYWSEWPTKEKQ